MKKKNFLSSLTTKLAVAAVALTTAFFAGCSEENIEMPGGGETPTPVLPNPTCVITVNVFDTQNGIVANPSLTASAGTVSGNTVTLTGESIAAQSVTITAAKGDKYVKDGVAVVSVPALNKGQNLYLSANIFMEAKGEVVSKKAELQVKALVFNNGKEIKDYSGLQEAEGWKLDKENGIFSMVSDKDIMAQNATFKFANDKFVGEASIILPAVAVGNKLLSYVVLNVVEKSIADKTEEVVDLGDGVSVKVPTDKGLDQIVADAALATAETVKKEVLANEDKQVTVEYTTKFGNKPATSAGRAVEAAIIAKIKALPQFNTYKEAIAKPVFDLKKGQVLSYTIKYIKDVKHINVEVTLKDGSKETVKFDLFVYNTMFNSNIAAQAAYTVKGQPVVEKGNAQVKESKKEWENNSEFYKLYHWTYTIQNGEKVIADKARETKSEIQARLEKALNTYSEKVVDSESYKVPAYYKLIGVSTVTMTPMKYTYTLVETSTAKEEALVINTVAYSSAFNATTEVIPGHEGHGHNGHGHGHGDGGNAGGGIIDPVN